MIRLMRYLGSWWHWLVTKPETEHDPDGYGWIVVCDDCDGDGEWHVHGGGKPFGRDDDGVFNSRAEAQAFCDFRQAEHRKARETWEWPVHLGPRTPESVFRVVHMNDYEA